LRQTDAVRFTQLWPTRAEVELDEHVAALDLPRLAPEDRPYTVANFVSSLDGRATFQGRSGALGDEGDRALFRALRTAADAVLVGTGTLRTERYGRMLRDPAARERRREAGRPAEPLACTVTRSGRIPLDIPLFAEPSARVVVFTARDIDVSGVAAQVQVDRLGPTELTFTAALRHLRERHGVRTLLCEGGPNVLGALLHEGVLDELFLTLAPRLAGGGPGLAVSAGPELPELAPATLIGVLERDGALFLRYRRRGSSP
jgi:riboflavin biosynthesis pyrimidine reductase